MNEMFSEVFNAQIGEILNEINVHLFLYNFFLCC